MKRIIPISLVAVASLYANEVQLSPISVESTILTEVSQNAQTSADLAQALSTSVPSIDISRRSGIANDIYIRGQNRDNISIEVDGTKICGACPNRMDPPVSHILANQIDEIEVIEGPYDVETFGTLSGGVKITTKKPTQKLHGEVNFGYGSWNYTKVGATVSGGNEVVRVLISGSSESSDQYRDGDGRTLSGQVTNNYLMNPADLAAKGAQYKISDQDMKAYTKRSLMAKTFITITDDQELRLGYTANRSDNVLYPNSKMDAIYDDSNIYSIGYDITNISDLYKKINLQYYKSDVDHPMGTDYRMVSAIKPISTHQLKTTMEGLKLKNDFELAQYKIIVGLDASERTWDGWYTSNFIAVKPSPTKTFKSIDNSSTKNAAIFAKVDRSFGALDLSVGARYNDTTITSDVTMQNNDYSGLDANIFGAYNLTPQDRIFLGFGQASRVPDARELYFRQNSPLPAPTGRIKTTGTPNLKETTNREIDLGYEASYDMFTFKIKGFYSMLDDYIYYQKNLQNNNFVNLDATVYGGEIASAIYATDDTTIDLGVSYKKGTKNSPAIGQDKDLANMAPLRANIALAYEYANNSVASMEVLYSDKWDDIDSINGEQVLSSWSILNLKVKHAVSKNFDFTLGVNNILNKTYASSNTYADLILVSSGTSDVMLLNDPGRYVYTNIDFRF